MRLRLLKAEIWLKRRAHNLAMTTGGLQAWYAHEFRRGSAWAKAWYFLPWLVCRYSWLPLWALARILHERQLAREAALDSQT